MKTILALVLAAFLISPNAWTAYETGPADSVLVVPHAGGKPVMSQVDLSKAAAVKNQLPVANGGTGAATLPSNGLVVGNGTSSVTTLAPGTKGSIAISNGTQWNSVTPGSDGTLLQAASGQTYGIQWATGLSMPTGAGITFDGITCPTGYLKEDGSAVSRTTYSNLFTALSIQTTGNTNSTTSLTNVASVTGMAVGMPIDGSGIPSGDYITAISGTGPYTVTLHTTASATATGITINVLPWGNGDGSTTFNVPNKIGVVERMVDSTGSKDPDFASRTNIATGVTEGGAIGTYQADQFASHTHDATIGNSTGTNVFSASNPFAMGDNGGGGASTRSNVVQARGGNETRGKNVAVLKCIKN